MATSLENALSCGVEREALRIDSWRRSARLYQMAGALLKAGEAWLAAGDKSVAADLFFAALDDRRAAELFFDCGRFSEAGISAERCLESASANSFATRIAARLVQAAVFNELGNQTEATNIVKEVRVELARLNSSEAQFEQAQAWESLARFGCRVKRSDLLRLGYEKALIVYGHDFNLQRLRCAHDYLEVVAGDQILKYSIEQRIIEFKKNL